MLVPDAPMHNWTLSRQSKLIRFYAWFIVNGPYGIGEKSEETIASELSSLTFCRLFWSVVLFPFAVLLTIAALPLLLLLAGIVWLAEKGSDRSKAKKAANQATSRAVDKTAGLADRVSAWFQRHPLVGKVGVVLMWTFMIVFALALLGTLVWLVVGFHNGLTTGLTWFGIVLAGALGLFLAAAIIAGLLMKTPLGPGLARIGEKVWSFLCWIGRGFRFTYRFFEGGHHAVKYRTCPKITIS